MDYSNRYHEFMSWRYEHPKAIRSEAMQAFPELPIETVIAWMEINLNCVD